MKYIWIFFVAFRVQCDQTTLTTTEPRAHTYPIPTRHLDDSRAVPSNNNSVKPLQNRRLNDAKEDSVPLDLFKWKDIDMRRSKVQIDDVWTWDLYCHLQPMEGNCKEETERYYYDAQLDRCATFVYTGCKGNKNNFETALECERRCKGANFMGVKEKQLPTVCYLQPDPGLCLAFITNFYFDVNYNQCNEFTFGGCGGNLNRFETMADCEVHCLGRTNFTTKTTSTTITEAHRTDKTF